MGVVAVSTTSSRFCAVVVYSMCCGLGGMIMHRCYDAAVCAVLWLVVVSNLKCSARGEAGLKPGNSERWLQCHYGVRVNTAQVFR